MKLEDHNPNRKALFNSQLQKMKRQGGDVDVGVKGHYDPPTFLMCPFVGTFFLF